ncbi:MAG: TIGR00730 family Rossman fold protein [Nitrospira sp.]|nr:TIGR00730 family Rossman fold protein [Nitrospira sp.]
MNNVCVFCGSSTGLGSRYAEMAGLLGKELAARGLGLVYGGGNIGLMEVVANASRAGDGRVIGVIPEFMVANQWARHDVSALHVVASMHERKALMSELADAFIALPGGYGTLEEFCETITWRQLQLHQKPCGLLNVDGFFDAFLTFLDHQVREGFLAPDNRALIRVASDPATLLDLLNEA